MSWQKMVDDLWTNGESLQGLLDAFLQNKQGEKGSKQNDNKLCRKMDSCYFSVSSSFFSFSPTYNLEWSGFSIQDNCLPPTVQLLLVAPLQTLDVLNVGQYLHIRFASLSHSARQADNKWDRQKYESR